MSHMMGLGFTQASNAKRMLGLVGCWGCSSRVQEEK